MGLGSRRRPNAESLNPGILIFDALADQPVETSEFGSEGRGH